MSEVKNLEDIEDSVDELVEAISALSDETVDGILRNGMSKILDDFKILFESISNTADDKVSKLETKIDAYEKDINDLKVSIADIEKENKTLKSELATATTTRNADSDILDEIINVLKSKGKTISSSTSSVEITPETVVNETAAKPLKKITLPSKKIPFEYFYGIELNCGLATLHIVKVEDWNRDELSKEGRVDTDTIARLKEQISLHRDRFIYTVNDLSFANLEEAKEAVNEAIDNAKINIKYLEDISKKFGMP